jgi:hypothetical protein
MRNHRPPVQRNRTGFARAADAWEIHLRGKRLPAIRLHAKAPDGAMRFDLDLGLSVRADENLRRNGFARLSVIADEHAHRIRAVFG